MLHCIQVLQHTIRVIPNITVYQQLHLVVTRGIIKITHSPYGQHTSISGTRPSQLAFGNLQADALIRLLAEFQMYS